MAGKQIVITIIFIAILVVLAGFIAIRAAIIYKSTTGYANQTTMPIVECTGYVYSVSEIDYSNMQLSFLLENKLYSDKKIDNIVIVADNSTREVAADLITGTQKRVIIDDININKTFFVFPKGCELHAKEYTIE